MQDTTHDAALDAEHERQHFLARHLGARLTETVDNLADVMTPHAITTALMGTALGVAGRHLDAESVARWLEELAAEVRAGAVERTARAN